MTKVTLDLARIDELTQVVDELAGALPADIEGQAGYLWVAQRETKEKETLQGQRWSTKFDLHLWDLGTVAARLAANSDSAAVQDAARAVEAALQPGGAVIVEGHQGDWFDGIGGVSSYIVPLGVQRISPYYAKVVLAQDMRWGEMLQAYHDELA